jgi:tetratricopeptide (TPR) repeat protein
MTDTRSFKKKLSEALRLWGDGEFDQALGDVEELLRSWPGNPRLYIIWASLVQLQDNPTHGLGKVKKALQHAVDLDKDSPAGAIELGHFLDAVEDNPQAASKAFSDAIQSARRLLIDGLLGRARALLQLDKREEAFACVMEALHLADVDYPPKRAGADNRAPDVLWRDSAGRFLGFQLKGPFASRIEDLLKELFLNRSA